MELILFLNPGSAPWAEVETDEAEEAEEAEAAEMAKGQEGKAAAGAAAGQHQGLGEGWGQQGVAPKRCSS
jgi:hypothetical protein